MRVLEGNVRAMSGNREKTLPNKGWVHHIELVPPSLKDNTSDAERLTNALQRQLQAETVQIDLELLKTLPTDLRRWSYRLRCVLFRDRLGYVVVGLAPIAESKCLAGLAVDLGTSRVALRLIDLETHKTIAESGFDNPQLQFGPDILSRIHVADESDGLATLQQTILAALNRSIQDICQKQGLTREDIYLLALAGNTTMTHLCMGLNPHWIIREPYIPVVNRPGVLMARDLGIEVARAARVLIFPNIGSYFGGDLIAGLLSTGIHRSTGVEILVDVGTNAEVVLGNRNWLIACAGAAGSALESGVTRMGMMAGPGVIDQVRIDAATGEITLRTIDDLPPVGICGSGLIDLAAQLFQSGMIDIQGRFVPEQCGAHFTLRDGVAHFMLQPDVVPRSAPPLGISQIDLDSLLRSKAAMYTILETITESVGIRFSDVSQFYVGGTFGSLIDPRSAVTIGMLPDLPLQRYRAVGNSSLAGAAQVLTEPHGLSDIDAIRDRITYMELNVNQAFMNRFSAAKFIPHTNPSLFPSVKIPL